MQTCSSAPGSLTQLIRIRMKKVNTSTIAPGAGYPPSKKGLDFLQQSYQEVVANLAQALIGNVPSTTLGYVLYGCIRTSLSGTNYAFTAGAIYFNGEIYAVDAIASVSITTAAVLTLTVTNDPIADPTTFSDGSIQSVHNVRKLVISNGTLGSATLNYDDLVFILVPLSSSTATTGTSVLSHTATVNALQRSWVRNGNIVTFNFLLSINITSGSAALSANIPLPIPGIVNSPDRGVAHSSGPTAAGGIIQIDRSFNGASDMGISSIATYGTGTFVISGQLVYNAG
jgi:hypothetical protein